MSPLAILVRRLRARASEEDARRLEHPRGSYAAGECRGRAFVLADVAAQLEAMINPEGGT